MEKLNVTPDEIAEKSFNVELKGYSPDEVDAFLDLILGDYEKMENNIQELLDIIASLKEENEKLRIENVELEGKAKHFDLSNTTRYSSVDFLRRVSRLEEEVSRLEKELDNK